MQQVAIYNNDTAPDDLAADKSSVKWGWRYDGDDTGLVFKSRDDAFTDALGKHPDKPIG